MASRTEHLLACLAEEGAEVTQAATKALRFGVDDINPHTNRNAVEQILHEFIDLMAVMEMLQIDGVLPKLPLADTRIAVERKIARVEEWMRFAEQRGALVTNDGTNPKETSKEI